MSAHARDVLERVLLGFAAFILAAFLAGQALQRTLNHDEHQFVASGWLLAREGLLPYRDYPYFHLPYLAILYATLFSVTDHLLLGARTISAVAALAAAAAIYSMVAARDTRTHRLLGVSVVAAWALNPVVQIGSGLAWNHDVSLGLALCSLWLLGEQRRSGRRLFASGLCIALATGVRATLAFGLILIGALLLLERRRRQEIAAWFAGCLVGLLPLAGFYALAPDQFVFGNWTYAALNTEWRALREFDVAMTPAGKAAFLSALAGGSLSTITLVVLGCSGVVYALRRPHSNQFATSAGMMLVMVASAFAPTPTFEQYYFAAASFAALTAGLLARSLGARWSPVIAALLLAVSVPQVGTAWSRVVGLSTPSAWVPLQVHAMGIWVAEQVPAGPVASLAPGAVLEGGRTIFPELATGPFAYRVGVLVDPAERRTQHVIALDDFGATFANRTPRAFLLGFESEELEEPLAEWAQGRRYRYYRLPNGKHLWIAP